MKLIFLVMAYLNMAAEVHIGDILIKQINSCVIEESVTEISDKATITLAKNYKELKGNPVLKYIKPGAPVEIKLGYNGQIETEFTGFVKPGVGADFPVVVECDELFPLRSGNIVLSERQITLKQLLQRVCPGYEIECPHSELGKFLINNASPYAVLTELKNKYGFFARINGNRMAVDFAYAFNPSFTKNHKYTIGEDCKPSDNLKFKTDIDYNVRVEAVVVINGKKQIITSGSDNKDAKVEKLHMNANASPKAAKASADALLHKILYAGYTGDIVGFGVPRTRAGDSLDITDTSYPEREGRYLIEKVRIEFAESHIERINTLSFKV